MAILPVPEHIFVCDNSNEPSPVDNAERVIREVHPSINYVYIPEGNKTHSIWWTSYKSVITALPLHGCYSYS